MPEHMSYDGNYRVEDYIEKQAKREAEVEEEAYDPDWDDPRNPRGLRLPQTLGCMIVVCSIAAAAAIGGCSHFFGEKKAEQKQDKKEQIEQTEKVTLPKKVASRMGDWSTTWSQALHERGDR